MSILDEIAAEAAALAEIQTQTTDLIAAEDSMEAETAKMAGHTVKRMAVATSEDGGPEGRPIQVDDCENTVFGGKTPGDVSDDPMGRTARTEQHQNIDLLQQMTILCQTVQNLGKQMQEGFEAERTRRQEDIETESLQRQDDFYSMEWTTTTKMEDGFKGEQMARQQAQDEIKQMAKKDLDAFKEEMRGEVETQCVAKRALEWVWEALAPAARPLALASRFSDIFLPRKMKFKGCVTDYKQCSYQGLTDTEVLDFVRDLQEMLPDQYQKYIDWDQTRTEQGTWPTKSIVCIWFRNETNLPTMVGTHIVKKELKKEHYKLHGHKISSRLEMCPKRKPLAKVLFYKGLKAVGGNEAKIKVVYGKIR